MDRKNKNGKLGIIGGMGPLATQLFYRKIIEMTDASKDQDHLDMILLNHASMPDRTQAIESGKTEEFFSLLLEDGRWLEENSVSAIAIPCNTSHFFVDRLQSCLNIPVIHMVRETINSIKQLPDRISCVGILATDGTLKGQLYQNECIKAGIRPVVPSGETQDLVMKIIYQGIKAGEKIDYNDFIKIEGELSANGCQRAIMACTELSCFKEIYNLPDYYIDAMDVLAARSIEACGKKINQKISIYGEIR